jgi:glutathione S-transferase
MKLYMHPVSTTCRPILQFMVDARIEAENQIVDVLKGEQYGEAYSKLNPNHLIPLLEDGDFRLTESAAILRYLADKAGSAAYPKDLRQRAKVDEMLDWFNSNFYKDFGYGLVYPQLFPHLKRPDPAVQAATLEWGRDKSKAWLQVLNDNLIGPSKTYLCGAEPTIADYFGAALVGIGDLIHCDFAAYPNVRRWLAAMRERPSYAAVSKVFIDFCASTKEQSFVRV